MNLPQIPWLAVLNPEVTRTARSGLYVVYLFAADLGSVYLSMNQGATAHQEHCRANRRAGQTIDGAAIAELRTESAAIRAELPVSLIAPVDDAVDLRSAGFLPKAYEAGSIAAVAYKLVDLPNEATLRADLFRFISIYDAAVDARTRLTAVDPGRFYTPTIHDSPGPDRAAELFRPKNSADYVAQIGAQTQVRSRRHEAVLRSFGEHAAERGWRRPRTSIRGIWCFAAASRSCCAR